MWITLVCCCLTIQFHEVEQRFSEIHRQEGQIENACLPGGNSVSLEMYICRFRG